jgi:hypothetical protein
VVPGFLQESLEKILNKNPFHLNKKNPVDPVQKMSLIKIRIHSFGSLNYNRFHSHE